MRVEVKNSTKKLCVIGEPVLHSKSPADSEHHAGRPGAGLRLPLPAGALGDAGSGWNAPNLPAMPEFNTTMPHKEELVELMDELDGDARLFGPVNTVCIRDSRAYGTTPTGRAFSTP